MAGELTARDGGECIVWRECAAGEEEVLLGEARLYGVAFHAWAVRVEQDDAGCQVAVKDPYDRLGDAYAGMDADVCWQTVELPGREGRWVVFLHPHGE